MPLVERKRGCDKERLKLQTDSDVNAIKRTKVDTPSKVAKFEKFIDKVPHEIILQLKCLLTRRDVISLASTSKRVRKRLLPYVFDRVKCSWLELLSSWHNSNGVCAPIGHPELVEGIRITSFCSKNEWTFQFHMLFSSDPSVNPMLRLECLSMLSSGSTNFFKYCGVASNLKKLSLKAVKNSSVFSLEHIKQFPSLQELNLTGFHIEDSEVEVDTCAELGCLKLENCTWCYPFNLESFGKDKINTLHLKYSNSFIVSERFKHLLNFPSFTNLRELSIINNEKSLELTISLKIMNLIHAMPTLETLILSGNIYNEALNGHASSRSQRTSIVALNNVKVFYSSFLRDLG
ncbi:LAQU0S27e00254g1_1 [Lachancea quebecensis]|uniref:LAQU0S27e00254g1_1 n=1 Tax=Lachancea quebecensis TaxID=1654605 RepID=A0A0P1KXU4_9SACH|nr:LAQU0S27e00254g1_1 [Lachancea quebecensis]